MEDRQTGSIWTHYDGQVLVGPLAASGIDLPIVPIIHTTWEEWAGLFPDSLVLDWYPEFDARYRDVRPGTGGIGDRFQDTIGNWDDRLPENELVLGVDADFGERAYPLAELPAGLAVITDAIDGQPIVVFADASHAFAIAYDPVVDGVEVDFSVVDDVIVDSGGSVWGLDGLATKGPFEGTRLEFVTSFVTEWYGWAAYHPETTIWEG